MDKSVVLKQLDILLHKVEFMKTVVPLRCKSDKINISTYDYNSVINDIKTIIRLIGTYEEEI